MSMPSFAQIDKPEADERDLYADMLIRYRELLLGHDASYRLAGVSYRTMARIRRAAREGREYQASRAYLYTLASNLADLLTALDRDLREADKRMGRKHKMRRLDRRPNNPVKAWRR